MKNKIRKISGWVLIGYGAFPLIVFAGLFICGPKESLPVIPPSSPSILRVHSVPEALILIHQITAAIFLIVSFLVVIGSLITGIALLRLKKWARKFGLVIFSVSVISRLLPLCVWLSHPYLQKAAFSDRLNILSYVLYLIFELLIIWILWKKINPITSQSSNP